MKMLRAIFISLLFIVSSATGWNNILENDSQRAAYSRHHPHEILNFIRLKIVCMKMLRRKKNKKISFAVRVFYAAYTMLQVEKLLEEGL